MLQRKLQRKQKGIGPPILEALFKNSSSCTKETLLQKVGDVHEVYLRRLFLIKNTLSFKE